MVLQEYLVALGWLWRDVLVAKSVQGFDPKGARAQGGELFASVLARTRTVWFLVVSPKNGVSLVWFSFGFGSAWLNRVGGSLGVASLWIVSWLNSKMKGLGKGFRVSIRNEPKQKSTGLQSWASPASPCIWPRSKTITKVQEETDWRLAESPYKILVLSLALGRSRSA